MSGQGKKYWFSVTNKRLTHQPITRKIIVCKTLNVIFFFFFFKQKKKKKNFQPPPTQTPPPPLLHAGNCRTATLEVWGSHEATPEWPHGPLAATPNSVVGLWRPVAEMVFCFKTKIVKGKVLIQCFARFC